jgi:hypothetical protein
MAIRTISVVPTKPGKFDAFHAERQIVAASQTPFCDAARALLAEGLAAPSDVLVMSHGGSAHDALKASVAVAAKLTVVLMREFDDIGLTIVMPEAGRAVLAATSAWATMAQPFGRRWSCFDAV